MKKRDLLRFFNVWPPFLGAGIRVRRIASDFRSFEVEMKLHFWNRNYNGTHFGGSLYSMTDPFYALILIEALGPRFVVWDKASSIVYKKPGTGRVIARFHVDEGTIDTVRRQAETVGKSECELVIPIHDEAGDVVAEVKKLLYVRKKEARSERKAGSAA